jgi:hypothetical protein
VGSDSCGHPAGSIPRPCVRTLLHARSSSSSSPSGGCMVPLVCPSERDFGLAAEEPTPAVCRVGLSVACHFCACKVRCALQPLLVPGSPANMHRRSSSSGSVVWCCECAWAQQRLLLPVVSQPRREGCPGLPWAPCGSCSQANPLGCCARAGPLDGVWGCRVGTNACWVRLGLRHRTGWFGRCRLLDRACVPR